MNSFHSGKIQLANNPNRILNLTGNWGNADENNNEMPHYT